MLKRDELADPESCLNKAKDDEPVFVLLGRDEDARMTIYLWSAMRVFRGKNKWNDNQISSALALAGTMAKSSEEKWARRAADVALRFVDAEDAARREEARLKAIISGYEQRERAAKRDMDRLRAENVSLTEEALRDASKEEGVR